MEDHGFFFNHQGKKLYGFLHSSKKSQKNKSAGYVFCSPFAEEKVRTQRLYVNLARLLSSQGIHVLRFDFYGNGDSEGEFHEASFRSHVEEIHTAIDVLIEKTGAGNIGVFGGRLGGTLSMMAAETDNRIKDVLLWDPIIDVHQYLMKILRSNLASQTLRYKKILYNRNQLEKMILNGEFINIDGYELTKQFYSEAMTCHLIQDIHKYSGNCLIVEISPRELLKKPPLSDLYEHYKNTFKDCQYLKISENVFWEAQRYYNPKPVELFNETSRWIKGKMDLS